MGLPGEFSPFRSSQRLISS